MNYHNVIFFCSLILASRNLEDPTKSILASVALTLGGLVPLHIKYNTARSRTTQDWIWYAQSASTLTITTI